MDQRLCFKTLFVLFVLFQTIKGQNTYTAAVVEHAPARLTNAKDTIRKNLQLYEDFIEKARNQLVDIIVFPEYGLTTLVEDPQEYAISLKNNTDEFSTEVLNRLRVAVFERGINTVVNLLERDTDAKNKTVYYNTNLVYNRAGTIIAKYRKINLFNEPNLTAGNETVTFTTDFGVNFGIMTCWDINFYNPSRALLRNGNVTDIVYPLAWYSTMPFYMPLSVQQGYAQATGVNLLAANYNNPSNGNGGSGIYRSNGAVAETYVDSTLGSKLVVQRLTKNTHPESTVCRRIQPTSFPGGNNLPLLRSNISNFVTFNDFKAKEYTFQSLDLSNFDISKEVCHKGFCCTFNITVGQANNNEVYKIMAYNGPAQLDKLTGHVRVCSLLACKNNDISSCGERINGTTRFSRLAVSGNNPPLENGTFYQPLTLTYDLQPISGTTYCTTDDQNTTTRIVLRTTSTQDSVLVFGIYGKVNSSAIMIQSTGVAFVVLVTIIKSVFELFRPL